MTTEDYKKCVIEIHPDEDTPNPRHEWDHPTTLVCYGRYSYLGDKEHQYHYGNQIPSELYEDAAAILAVFVYDHSGLTINTSGFTCQWDSSKIGFIAISKEVAKRDYPNHTEGQLESILRGEIGDYDTYLTGGVVGFVTKDPNGEEIDCCWGFYGDEYAKEEARASIDGYWKERHALFEQAGVEVAI